MLEFFHAVKELYESEIIKSHNWTILILFVLIVFISWMFMAFIFIKLVVPYKTIKAQEIKLKAEGVLSELDNAKNRIVELEKENENLRKEIAHLKIQSAFTEDDTDNESFNDKALKKFVD